MSDSNVTRTDTQEGDVQLKDVLLSELEKYKSFLDLNREDLLLKLVSQNQKTIPCKESIFNVVSLVRNKLTSSDVGNLQSFLDLLLVKNSVFIEKYLEWQRKLANLDAVVRQAEAIATEGAPLKLHKGLIICTATDSTEDKVIAHYGGTKWKRILNFLRGTPSDDLLGRRGGASYVSLVTDNTVNHTHGISVKGGSGSDFWKKNSTASSNSYFRNNAKPGANWSSKNVFPELAALGWSTDTTDEKPNEGTSRYVKPHFNIPPYKDVYFWECEDPNPPSQSEESPVEVDEFDLLSGMVKSAIERKESSGEAPNDISIANIKDAGIKPAGMNSLEQLTVFDTWCILVSDELQASSAFTRYDSKNATLKDLADISSYVVFQETLQLHKRYLFKETYRYLISQIQDRIYLLLKRLADVTGEDRALKLKAVLGQYILTANDSPSVISDNYILPPGCTARLLPGGVFLRGTPTFTEETAGEYAKYTGASDSSQVKTSGGASSVPLYGINFPKHLHWSTILQPMSSVNVTELPNVASGGSGTDLYMGDPVSGGVKYGFLSGSGNYSFTVSCAGSEQTIYHSNIPSYKTLRIYQVVQE